jgi:NAD(P)-dependent dehydrogenase (short-subunit alcohol dehydrogenase family)
MNPTLAIVLVTGATSGIGRHAALTLARRGMRVLASGRNDDLLARLTAEGGGLAIEGLPLDVTNAASIETARAEVLERTAGHGVDILINNAGYGEVGPVASMSDDRLRSQFETNVFGLMATTRAFLPEMKRRGGGRIINISSLSGTFTLPLFGAYSATKYALESISDAMRIELAPLGIHVSLIQPGTINTAFTSRSVTSAARATDGGDPVEARAQRALERLERMAARIGVGPEHTSRAIWRAAVDRRPRARYATPWFASWSIALVHRVPTRWRDAILRRAIGLGRDARASGEADASR